MGTTEDGDAAVTFRAARPQDRAAVESIDGSFTTDTVFAVRRTETGFTIVERAVDPPVRKTFPDDGEGEADDADTRTVVAEAEGRVCGYVTTVFQRWNRRLVVADLGVAPPHRGRGIGAALLERAVNGGGAWAPAMCGWRSPTSTPPPSASTGEPASNCAAWTRPCTRARNRREKRPCS
ncbi:MULTISPECIES: GNAT family N-acetyltransferase [unclassified Streptomyces]|uniref:GNAT family N-acetyltransferase n=1 Tax=unclassified Streptomyces TaxID=2593676 RepID=UPI0036FB6638